MSQIPDATIQTGVEHPTVLTPLDAERRFPDGTLNAATHVCVYETISVFTQLTLKSAQ